MAYRGGVEVGQCCRGVAAYRGVEWEERMGEVGRRVVVVVE